jgi:hypothetical protein
MLFAGHSLVKDRSALWGRTAELVEFAGRSGNQSDRFFGIRRFVDRFHQALILQPFLARRVGDFIRSDAFAKMIQFQSELVFWRKLQLTPVFDFSLDVSVRRLS